MCVCVCVQIVEIGNMKLDTAVCDSLFKLIYFSSPHNLLCQLLLPSW